MNDHFNSSEQVQPEDEDNEEDVASNEAPSSSMWLTCISF